MSYDPTERAPQPGDRPAYDSGVPPAPQPGYGQSNPSFPPYGQQQQPPVQQPTPAYGQPAPSYGQSNPSLSPYGQQSQSPVPAYGQSNPSFPPFEQMPLASGQQTPVAPTVYGQSSNPSLPPYGQGTPSTPNFPPYQQPATDPYGQQAVPPAWGGNVPPGYQPPVPAKKKSGLRIFLIILVVVVLLLGAGGGGLAYYLSRPKPVITLTSSYHVSGVPAGATGTTFQVKGTDFSGTSAITFLLDNASLPGGQPTQSDSQGNVTATLTVTADWGAGNHTITAKDASGYATKVGLPVAIVPPGQDSTPGPNGAPPDDASGTIVATIQVSGQSDTANMTIKGSDSGGTVCGDEDDGQPHTRTGTADGENYTETIVMTCSGTYKGGKLTYTETVTSDKIDFDDGIDCTASVPYVNIHLEGTFTSNTAVSGSFSQDAVTATCSFEGTTQSNSNPAQTGTWTGIAAMQSDQTSS